MVTSTSAFANRRAAARPATPLPMIRTDRIGEAPVQIRRCIMAAVKTWILLLTLTVLLGCGNSGAPTMQSNAPSTGSSTAASKAPDERAALEAISQINEAQKTYFKLN